MNEDASIYQLICRLCSSLTKESQAEENSLSLNCAKQIAFLELLKSNGSSEIYENEKLDEEFEKVTFELALANREKDSKQLIHFNNEINKKSQIFSSVCWLLFYLRNIDPDVTPDKLEKNFFKISSNINRLNKKNVYLPHSHKIFIQLSTNAITLDDDCSFFSDIFDSYNGSKKKKNQLVSNTLKLNELTRQSSETSKISYKKIKTWENLETYDEIEKSFSSESHPHFYERLTLSGIKAPVEIKMLSLEKILNDIKLLSIGIESESFKRIIEEDNLFYVKENFSCENISDISHYVEEFLEAGTCFSRLKAYITKNSDTQTHIHEGYVFKAFCDSTNRFINYYRDFFYSQEVETFLQLSVNTKFIRNILIHITKFLRIHPNSYDRGKLRNVSEFLSLLYNEYTSIFDHGIKSFFVECLKSCCQIYFNNFHKWLFHGIIDDPSKELFVFFIDHYQPDTKYFFDRAYQIEKDSVPGFLHGCAETILFCGKYTMLLKSYNQIHPLFMLHKPPLKVCLTNEELSEIRSECKSFANKARDVCGEKISFSTIIDDKKQMKKDNLKKSEAASSKNIQKWRQEQEVRRVELAEKRENHMKCLQDELRRIEENKIVKRMESIQSEYDYMREVDKLEEDELKKENIELRNSVECYEKLSQQIDEENVIRDKLVSDLKSSLESKEKSSTTNKQEDALNANDKSPNQSTEITSTITDEMNNIVVTTTTMTEAQRNKLKIMSHEFNLSPQVDCDETKDGNSVKEMTIKSLTDAQKNKMKVLGHEFGLVDENKIKSLPKINVERCETLSDLQKNRIKVLSHEFNLEREISPPTMTLNISETEQSKQQQLESPMSITSDHFSNDSENHRVESENKSPDESTEMAKISNDDDDDEEQEEMLRAFQDAIEKNCSNFMRINLDEKIGRQSSVSYDNIRTTDTMAMSQFLQLSLMLPVNTYMEILNNETMKMFIKDLDILSHFKSLRNYFLMMNGEFGLSVCDQLFNKLESGVRPSELLNYQSLHMILNQALCRSRHDPNTENVSFIVTNIPERFELYSPTVLNMLTMSYKLKWPLTLILNPETMEQYQAIFNYLLKLKRISWVLDECFQLIKDAGKKHGNLLLISRQFRNVQFLRHKMTHFVHTLENHITTNVLQISWNAFVEDLKTAKSIQTIYRKHTNYLKRVFFLCLINKNAFEFQKGIENLFKVILKFYKHLKSSEWVKNGNYFQTSKFLKLEADADDFGRSMKYLQYVGNKLTRREYQKELYDLLYLININEYYSETIDNSNYF